MTRRVYLLLALIVGLYVALGVAFAVRTPRWQAPDEPAHYNYVRHLADGRGLPVLQPGDYDQAHLNDLWNARFPDSLPVDSLRYEAHQPPLYYLLATPVYVAVRSLPLDRQVLALRLVSVLLGALLLLVAFATVRRVFPEDPTIALGTTAFVAAVPQHLAMTSAINNDTLGELVLTLLVLVLIGTGRELWESRAGLASAPGAPTPSLPSEEGEPAARLSAQGGGEPASLAWLVMVGLLLGLALLTKTNVYVALLLVPLGVWLRLPQAQRSPAAILASPRLRLVAAGPAAGTSGASPSWGAATRQSPLYSLFVDRLAIVHAVALVVGGWWFMRNVAVYGGLDVFGWQRHDLVVLGQPRTVLGWEALRHFVTVTFRSFWVQLGWMSVPADDRTYWFLGLLSASAALGLAVFLLRARRQPSLLRPEQWRCLLVLATTLMLVFLSMAQYNLRYVQPQGRYLFYAIVPIGVFFALGLRELGQDRTLHLVLALVVAGTGAYVLLALRDLIPLRVDQLLFAGLAAAVGATTVLSVREILWPRLSVPPDWIALGAGYFLLLFLDLVALLRLVPLLA